MKTTRDEDDEPILVLLLFVVASLCVIMGMTVGMLQAREAGMGMIFVGFGVGLAVGSTFWFAALVLRLLWRIERNTRGGRADSETTDKTRKLAEAKRKMGF